MDELIFTVTISGIVASASVIPSCTSASAITFAVKATEAERTATFELCVFSNVDEVFATVFTNLATLTRDDTSSAAATVSNTAGNFDIDLTGTSYLNTAGVDDETDRIGYVFSSALGSANASTANEDTCSNYTLTMVLDEAEVKKAKQGTYSTTLTIDVNTAED
jgi:hypothetical protein